MKRLKLRIPGDGRQRLLAGTTLAGIAIMAAGVLMVVNFMRTPEIILEHPNFKPHNDTPAGDIAVAVPSPTGPISAYAAGHDAPPRPEQPKVGTWLEIPALEIALPVQQGDGTDKIPYWVALRYPGTANPGEKGNSYLYAHGLWGMFGSLLFARAGQAVYVHDYTTGNVRTLHVSKVVGKIHYNDTRWVRFKADNPTLTLQTCVDNDPRGDRYVVLAS